MPATQLGRQRGQRVHFGFTGGQLDGSDLLIVDGDGEPFGFAAMRTEAHAGARARLVEPKIVAQRASVCPYEGLPVPLDVFTVVRSLSAEPIIGCGRRAT